MATLTIPDKLYERLKALAASQQQSVDDFMIEVIEDVAPDDAANNGAPLTRDEEMRRLRTALKGTILSEEESAQLFPWLDENPMTEEEIDEILATLPELNPTLSQTIIQMREEERY